MYIISSALSPPGIEELGRTDLDAKGWYSVSYVSISACRSVKDVCVCVCARACVCTYVYVYIYIYIHVQECERHEHGNSSAACSATTLVHHLPPPHRSTRSSTSCGTIERARRLDRRRAALSCDVALLPITGICCNAQVQPNFNVGGRWQKLAYR